MKTLVLRILLSVILFTMITCSTDPLGGSALLPTNPSDTVIQYNYSESETEFAVLINDYRVGKGLNQLKLNDYVSFKAEEHNLYMIQSNDISHAKFQERADAIIKRLGARAVSENIAYNFDSLQGVLDTWSESPAHKANLEGDFTDFGISISINPANQKKYYTVIFVKI